MPKKNAIGPDVLDELFAVIRARAGGDPAASYTARLMAKGTPKIAQKVGEEATETIVAALAETNVDLVNESADLPYNRLVLWADKDVAPADVYAGVARPRKK